MSRRIIMLLAALPLLVSGCSSDPEPKFETDPTPSAPVVPSPAVSSAPEEPVRFVARWLQLSVDMQNSGDSAGYRTVTEACRPCTDLADRVDQYYAAGGSITFAGQQATKSRVIPSASGTTVVRVSIRTGGTQYRTSGEAPAQSIAAGTDLLEVTLTSDENGSWNVSDFVRIAR